uniref:LRRCT domain-containing protein n=1 Tax=Callorhinchus milii TaxID=7868 RepID=V9KFC6_CALMI
MGAVNGPVLWRFQYCLLMLAIIWGSGVADRTCQCDSKSDFRTFDFGQLSEQCCLNFTGSSIGVLQWSVFTQWMGIQVLDLSNCNISSVQDGGEIPTSLEDLYLDHNQLQLLPSGFLGNAPGLKILHLENNQLRELPEAMLSASHQIQEVYLGCNRLVSVPSGVFKKSLGRLSLHNNSLQCSCALYDSLTEYFAGNRSSSGPENIMCFTANQPQGLDIQAINRSNICRSHGLTALFVCLPLVVILILVLFWYCCRTQKYDFNVMRQDNNISTIEKSGFTSVGEHHYIICRTPESPTWQEKSCVTRNQLLLRPSADLLGSSRDLYEEVEIKPAGLVDLAPQVDEVYLNISNGKVEEEEAVEEVQVEPDRVSVPEEMHEADRHILYMNKSANYYNLVPAIELDDSDHGEYENVDLS